MPSTRPECLVHGPLPGQQLQVGSCSCRPRFPGCLAGSEDSWQSHRGEIPSVCWKSKTLIKPAVSLIVISGEGQRVRKGSGEGNLVEELLRGGFASSPLKPGLVISLSLLTETHPNPVLCPVSTIGAGAAEPGARVARSGRGRRCERSSPLTVTGLPPSALQ